MCRRKVHKFARNNRFQELEGNNVEGVLVIKQPWPSIARTVWNDHKRCVNKNNPILYTSRFNCQCGQISRDVYEGQKMQHFLALLMSH